MAASGTLAFGGIGSCNYGPFGASSCTWPGWNLAPVGERVISYQPASSCYQPVSSCSYFAPRQGYTIRTIREPAIMPVGERFTTIRYSQPVMLEPVGERFTTVRVIRYQQPLLPVGERFTTVRTVRYQQQSLLPVGERFTTVKVIRHQPMLSSVGEKYSCKLIKHKKSMHKKVTFVRQAPLPVAERTIIRHHKILKPVGERTIIRTTTFHSSSCGCGF